ncbi:MAG: hypothetical protein JNJ83_01740 [Verrucomicrobiaceae bacterium]|nr:hypothetical protein [Verrucomicrobiaceae bacterium]
MFFDDLRGRSSSRAATSGEVTSQEGIYTYDDGAFLAPDQMAGQTDDTAWDIGAPLSNAGYTIYSRRQQGDYTQYASPYPSQGQFFSPTYTSDPYLGGKRNLKVGPVNFGFGLSSVFEYNDNVTRSTTEPVEDFILGSYLNISANWPVSKTNALSMNTALGFDHYFNHPEVHPYGGDFILNILPGSTIALDGVIGPVYVVLYDRFSVRPASQNDFSINTADIFGVLQNDVGLGATWAINSSLVLSVNYMHSTARVLNGELQNEAGIAFSGGFFDRDMDSVMASLSWSPAGTWTAGLEGNVTWVRYPEDYNNDGFISSAGAFLSTPLGKATNMRIAGGFQNMQFQAPPTFKRTATLAEVQEAYSQLLGLQELANVTAQEAIAAAEELQQKVAQENSDLGVLNRQLEARQAEMAQLRQQIAAKKAQLALLALNDPARPILEADITNLTAKLLALEQTPLPSVDKLEGVDEEELQALILLAQQQLSDNELFSRHSRDNSDLADFYANFTLSNRLTPRISHALSLGHESALNTTSNFITADYASYGVGIIAWRGSQLALSTYFEKSADSGGIDQYQVDEENIVQAISTREDIQQWGFDAYWTHQFTSRLRVGLGYHYGIVDSNLESKSYVQHAYNVDFNYAVSKRMTIGIGYRFFNTEADDDSFSFKQNRAILAMNYNF